MILLQIPLNILQTGDYAPRACHCKLFHNKCNYTRTNWKLAWRHMSISFIYWLPFNVYNARLSFNEDMRYLRVYSPSVTCTLFSSIGFSDTRRFSFIWGSVNWNNYYRPGFLKTGKFSHVVSVIRMPNINSVIGVTRNVYFMESCVVLVARVFTY